MNTTNPDAPQDYRDESHRADGILAMGLGIFAIAFLSPGILWGLPFGKTIVGAELVLNGGQPYRDFWSMYAPGQFWLVAALQSCFGHHLFVQALATVVITAGAIVVFFLLLRVVDVSRRTAIGYAGLLLLGSWNTEIELTSYPPALLLALTGLTLTLRTLGTGQKPTWIAAGAVWGFAAVFKHDVAAYFGLATTISVLTSGVSSINHCASSGSRSAVAMTGVLLTGIGLVVVPAAGALWFVAGRSAWNDLIAFPLQIFPGVRAEPFPSLWPPFSELKAWIASPGDGRLADLAMMPLRRWLLGYVPILVAAVFGLMMIFRKSGSARRRVIQGSFTLAIILFWMAAHVQQNTHLYSMALCAFGLLATASGRPQPMDFNRVTGDDDVDHARARTLERRWRVAFPMVLLGVGLLIQPAKAAALVAREWDGRVTWPLGRARGLFVGGSEAAFLGPIVRFINEHVPAGEPIYCGVQRHDAPVIGDLRFYYLSDRIPVTGYYEIHPGVTDRVSVQRSIRGDLGDVHCVVLWEFGWPLERLERIKNRNRSVVVDGGSTILDDYIAENFHEVERYGPYRVLWRNRPSGRWGSVKADPTDRSYARIP